MDGLGLVLKEFRGKDWPLAMELSLCGESKYKSPSSTAILYCHYESSQARECPEEKGIFL